MKGIDLLLPLAAHLHQSSLFQQVQVVGNAGLANGEALGELPGVQIPLLKALKDLPPGRIPQSLEDQ